MTTYLEKLQQFLAPYPGAYTIIILTLLLLQSGVAYYLTRWIIFTRVLRILDLLRLHEQERSSIRRKIAPPLVNIVPALVMKWGIEGISGTSQTITAIIGNCCSGLVVLSITMALSGVLSMIDTLYLRRPDAAEKPIKGFIQLGKIALYIVGGILVVATLIDRSPVILLSGLGAMAAVLMLIFQDTILSVVASIQIGSNDMIRIGDWIEMKSQSADGAVIEIALHTVKVQNWDKTITTIPVRKLITDAFINWRGMFDSGGRRIKRALHIDQRSVRFLKEEEVIKLKELKILNPYLDAKLAEIAAFNREIEAQGLPPVNHRNVTNLGTFRAYIDQYLRQHNKIHKDMITMVRQLPPADTGIPLEVYCFTNDTRWVAYEGIQADIFDHLLAIMPYFNLWVYQSESDMKN